MFPAFSFLPIRMKAECLPSVSSSLLLNRGDSPQLTNNTTPPPPRKDAQLKGCTATTRTCSHFRCPTMLCKNTHNTNAEKERARRDVAKRPKWLDKGLKRGKMVPRPVRTKLPFFSQHGGLKCSLTFCCMVSQQWARPHGDQCCERHTSTHPKHVH